MLILFTKTMLKINDATGATTGSGLTRPESCGEENQNRKNRKSLPL